ncbi:MAG: hypothetical protein MdMp014T_0594 [Treponematales bacterium]
MALTAGFIGCDNGAVDATITVYGLPGAAGPADLTVRHSELTGSYDFRLPKSGSIVLNVGTTTVQMDTNGDGTPNDAGYSTTGTFTDDFGVQYAVSGGFTNTGSTGSGTFYGTPSAVTGGGYTITATYCPPMSLSPRRLCMS